MLGRARWQVNRRCLQKGAGKPPQFLFHSQDSFRLRRWSGLFSILLVFRVRWLLLGLLFGLLLLLLLCLFLLQLLSLPLVLLLHLLLSCFVGLLLFQALVLSFL